MCNLIVHSVHTLYNVSCHSVSAIPQLKIVSTKGDIVRVVRADINK